MEKYQSAIIWYLHSLPLDYILLAQFQPQVGYKHEVRLSSSADL